MSEPNITEELARFDRIVKNLRNLMQLKAPPVLIADGMLNILTRYLIRAVGVEPVSIVLLHMIQKSLCMHAILCVNCKTRLLDSCNDDSDSALYCLKCQAEFEGMMVGYSETADDADSDSMGTL